ncbi:lipoprotein LpqH, partial [Mycobacterium scrofulaceum]|uniref:lipoprotein LpqH n=1 Tax=Mycobacterium scrofulaceum TaxID=1783 RepID=UPI001E5A98F5
LPLGFICVIFSGLRGCFGLGGVGDAHAEVTNDAFTIAGSAYGINSSNPNKVITTEFKIIAEC